MRVETMNPGWTRVLVAATIALLATLPGPRWTSADERSCGQEPGDRFYWIERAFCDLPVHGPERAHGIVIWNHGISGSTQSWMAPAPPVFRLLQGRGWDVLMLKRHHLAENMAGDRLYRVVQWTLREVAAARAKGYRKVVLAGQSFGGYVSLEAVDTVSDIDAVVALAPGVRASGADGRLDASITDRLLQRVKVGRMALVFPRHDAVFGYTVRGESAQAILSRRRLPYLLVDETSEVSGHGGAVTGRFALRYGRCLADFLAAPDLPAGRVTCPPPTDDWPLVRELLLPQPVQRPSVIRAGSTFPLGPLTGLRWAMLQDTVALVAPVEDGPGRLRLMYRSTGFGGGVFDATLEDGTLRAVLSNGARVTLSPEGEGVITWTSSDGSRSLRAPLVRGPDEP
jgi:pimeloyl-ACP methyl ester carboxylesterase